MISLLATLLIVLALKRAAPYPTGAGDCPLGTAAVTGHIALVQNGITGPLSTKGFSLSVDGEVIPEGGTINLSVGVAQTITLSGSTFKGHLIRIGVLASTLVPDSSNSQIATICGAMAGITHYNSNSKTSADGTLTLTEAQSGITVDVTVVVGFNSSAQYSEYYYSSYTLNAAAAGDSPTAAPAAVATIPPAALTSAPVPSAPVQAPIATIPPVALTSAPVPAPVAPVPAPIATIPPAALTSAPVPAPVAPVPAPIATIPPAALTSAPVPAPVAPVPAPIATIPPAALTSAPVPAPIAPVLAPIATIPPAALTSAPIPAPIAPVPAPIATLPPATFTSAPVPAPVAPVAAPIVTSIPAPISTPSLPGTDAPAIVVPPPTAPGANKVTCLPADCQTKHDQNGSTYTDCPQGLQCTVETTSAEATGQVLVVSYGCLGLNPSGALAGTLSYDLSQLPCSCGAVLAAQPCSCHGCAGATQTNVLNDEIPFGISCPNIPTPLGDCA